MGFTIHKMVVNLTYHAGELSTITRMSPNSHTRLLLSKRQEMKAHRLWNSKTLKA